MCPTNSLKNQIPCSPGLVAMYESSANCTVCSIGAYQPGTAADKCTLCEPGYFCPSEKLEVRI